MRLTCSLQNCYLRLNCVYQSHLEGKGGLELHPDLDLPSHQLKTNIHRMPGGYLDDREKNHFRSGVLYDHGVFLYGAGLVDAEKWVKASQGAEGAKGTGLE